MPEDKVLEYSTRRRSRIMIMPSGHDLPTADQIAVDEDSRLIVATTLTNIATDNSEWIPLLERVRSSLGDRPAPFLADTGERSEDRFAELEAPTFDAYVSLVPGGRGAPAAPKTPASRQRRERVCKRGWTAALPGEREHRRIGVRLD